MKKAIIIGNGPSLKNVDMDKLKNIDTFSFNRAFLAYKDWGFDPTFYACIDGATLDYCYNGIDELINRNQTKRIYLIGSSKALNYASQFPSKVKIAGGWRQVWLDKPELHGKYNLENFPNIASTGPISRDSVTCWSINVLYALGYTHVGMVGVDNKYEKGKNNYFIDGYETKRGIVYDVGNCLQKWKIVKRELETSNKLKLYSCNTDSTLNDMLEYLPINNFLNMET